MEINWEKTKTKLNELCRFVHLKNRLHFSMQCNFRTLVLIAFAIFRRFVFRSSAYSLTFFHLHSFIHKQVVVYMADMALNNRFIEHIFLYTINVVQAICCGNGKLNNSKTLSTIL